LSNSRHSAFHQVATFRSGKADPESGLTESAQTQTFMLKIGPCIADIERFDDSLLMRRSAVLLAMAGLGVTACCPQSDQARFEAAMGLPVCNAARIVWRPQISRETSLIGGHSYGAEVLGDFACLHQLRNDFERRTGTICTIAGRCTGQLGGKFMALEDQDGSVLVKVLLP
jgi:hypothetical protein